MSDEVFSAEVAFSGKRGGEAFSEILTESSQMTQTQFVIYQHLVALSVMRISMALGVASAAGKDPEFMTKYNAAMKFFGFPEISLPS